MLGGVVTDAELLATLAVATVAVDDDVTEVVTVVTEDDDATVDRDFVTTVTALTGLLVIASTGLSAGLTCGGPSSNKFNLFYETLI